MRSFSKRNINTTYSQLIPEHKISPIIIFSKKSMMWIGAIIENHNHEVGFYATVEEIGDYKFYIKNVYYPKHSEANTGTCTISSDGEIELIQYMINNNKMEEIGKIKLWGHKHMSGTSPSNQDESQTIDRIKSTNSYLIRVICDDKEMSVSFFDPFKNIRFDNIKWEIEKEDEELNLKKINEIKIIINKYDQEEISVNEVVDKISKAISDSSIYNKIVNKVLKLKEINIKTDINFNKQQSLFDNRNGYINNNNDFHEYDNFDMRHKYNNNKKKNLSSKIEFVDGKRQVVFYEDNKIIQLNEYIELLDKLKSNNNNNNEFKELL